MKKQLGFISPGDMQAFFITLIVIGILIGTLLAIGIPWIWNLIKPWIHTITG